MSLYPRSFARSVARLRTILEIFNWRKVHEFAKGLHCLLFLNSTLLTRFFLCRYQLARMDFATHALASLALL